MRRIEPHRDHRGQFTEVYREAWYESPHPVQWNVVSSEANVLRGFHCHVRHADALTVAAGSMVLGLHDLRPGSRTFGTALTILLPALSMTVAIDPGVAHGFYFPEPSVHVYAVSEYWNETDELRCRWDDPEVEIDWPCSAPLLSENDARAGSFSAMRDLVLARLGPAQEPHANALV